MPGYHSKPILSFRLMALAAVLGIAFVAPAAGQSATAIAPQQPTPPPCDWGQSTCTGQSYEAQGDPKNGPNGQPVPFDNSDSTVSYPGTFPITWEELILPTGQCFFILNTSSNTYFVPLNLQTEWNAFYEAVNKGTVPGVSIVACDQIPGETQPVCGCGQQRTIGLRSRFIDFMQLRHTFLGNAEFFLHLELDLHHDEHANDNLLSRTGSHRDNHDHDGHSIAFTGSARYHPRCIRQHGAA